jgi:EAL domain-containing protein (putative c-di-GMP-specific phosphodiesterase class I)/GGDEF domain-containing protein
MRILLILLTLMSLYSNAFASELENLDNKNPFTLDLFWLKDQIGNPTLGQLNNLDPAKSQQRWALGFKSDKQWFAWTPSQTQIDNYQSWPLELRVNYAILDHVTLFVYRDGQIIDKIISGDHINAPLKNGETPVFDIKFDAGHDYDILFSVKTNSSIFFEVNAAPANQSSLAINPNSLYWGAVYGILVGMLIYNLMIFSSVKETSFAAYMAFLACFIATLFIYYGHYRLVLPAPWLQTTSRFLSFILILSSGFVLLFSSLLLRLPKPIIRAAQTLLLLSPLMLISESKVIGIITSAILFIICLTCVMGGFYALYKKRNMAITYIIAWLPALTVVTLLSMQSAIGSMEFLSFLPYALPFSIVFAATLFSLAISEKISAAKQAAIDSQKEALLASNELTELQSYQHHSSYHCHITGLPNKASLFEAIINKKSDFSSYVAIFLESHQIEEVRAVFGINQEEALLRMASDRLLEIFKHSNVAHTFELKGDFSVRVCFVNNRQFCFLIAIDDIKTAQTFAELSFPAINQPFNVEGLTIDSSFHMAIVPVFSADLSPEEVLKRANITLQSGFEHKQMLSVYSNEIEHAKERRLLLIAGLRRTLDNEGDEFILNLQPQIRLEDEKVSGYEALIRWKHAQMGMIFPDEFIEVAEAAGIINEITLWVLNQCCQQVKLLQQNNLHVPISINISAKDLLIKNSLNNFLSIVKANDIQTKDIILEITETAALSDIQGAIDAMKALSDSGFELAIDDFGTGHSSFEYLKYFPVKELKIDKSFILDFDDKNQLLTRTMIELANNLSLSVVAEGVENKETAEQLKRLGCENGQGYLWSKPLPASDIITWAKAHNSLINSAHNAS